MFRNDYQPPKPDLRFGWSDPQNPRADEEYIERMEKAEQRQEELKAQGRLS